MNSLKMGYLVGCALVLEFGEQLLTFMFGGLFHGLRNAIKIQGPLTNRRTTCLLAMIFGFRLFEV